MGASTQTHRQAGARRLRDRGPRTWLRRHRRVVAASASALAVLCLGLALRPPAPDMRRVVVVGRDLATGHRLGPADLALAEVPAAVLPPGSTADPGDVTGAVLAAPALRGEPVSTARLVPSLAGLAAPTGMVPAPVRFADPVTVSLLSSGQSVDVLAARASAAEDLEGIAYPAPAQLLASRALVLAVLEADPDGEGIVTGVATSVAPLVVLALTPGQARAVAGAEATSRLSFTLAGP
jgi:pilus assembly protein CpaB